MGRIKTKMVKRASEELVDKHLDQFTENFDDNKTIVTQYTDIPSKKLRNLIAGYVTRLIKNREKI